MKISYFRPDDIAFKAQKISSNYDLVAVIHNNSLLTVLDSVTNSKYFTYDFLDKIFAIKLYSSFVIFLQKQSEIIAFCLITKKQRRFVFHENIVKFEINGCSLIVLCPRNIYKVRFMDDFFVQKEFFVKDFTLLKRSNFMNEGNVINLKDSLDENAKEDLKIKKIASESIQCDKLTNRDCQSDKILKEYLRCDKMASEEDKLEVSKVFKKNHQVLAEDESSIKNEQPGDFQNTNPSKKQGGKDFYHEQLLISQEFLPHSDFKTYLEKAVDKNDFESQNTANSTDKNNFLKEVFYEQINMKKSYEDDKNTLSFFKDNIIAKKSTSDPAYTRKTYPCSASRLEQINFFDETPLYTTNSKFINFSTSSSHIFALTESSFVFIIPISHENESSSVAKKPLSFEIPAFLDNATFICQYDDFHIVTASHNGFLAVINTKNKNLVHKCQVRTSEISFVFVMNQIIYLTGKDTRLSAFILANNNILKHTQATFTNSDITDIDCFQDTLFAVTNSTWHRIHPQIDRIFFETYNFDFFLKRIGPYLFINQFNNLEIYRITHSRQPIDPEISATPVWQKHCSDFIPSKTCLMTNIETNKTVFNHVAKVCSFTSGEYILGFTLSPDCSLLIVGFLNHSLLFEINYLKQHISTSNAQNICEDNPSKNKEHFLNPLKNIPENVEINQSTNSTDSKISKEHFLNPLKNIPENVEINQLTDSTDSKIRVEFSHKFLEKLPGSQSFFFDKKTLNFITYENKLCTYTTQINNTEQLTDLDYFIEKSDVLFLKSKTNKINKNTIRGSITNIFKHKSQQIICAKENQISNITKYNFYKLKDEITYLYSLKAFFTIRDISFCKKKLHILADNCLYIADLHLKTIHKEYLQKFSCVVSNSNIGELFCCKELINSQIDPEKKDLQIRPRNRLRH